MIIQFLRPLRNPDLPEPHRLDPLGLKKITPTDEKRPTDKSYQRQNDEFMKPLNYPATMILLNNSSSKKLSWREEDSKSVGSFLSVGDKRRRF